MSLHKLAGPVGWIIDGDGKPWPPYDPHSWEDARGGFESRAHNYDGGCSWCRCGDQPAARDAVIELVAGEAVRELLTAPIWLVLESNTDDSWPLSWWPDEASADAEVQALRASRPTRYSYRAARVNAGKRAS